MPCSYLSNPTEDTKYVPSTPPGANVDSSSSTSKRAWTFLTSATHVGTAGGGFATPGGANAVAKTRGYWERFSWLWSGYGMMKSWFSDGFLVLGDRDRFMNINWCVDWGSTRNGWFPVQTIVDGGNQIPIHINMQRKEAWNNPVNRQGFWELRWYHHGSNHADIEAVSLHEEKLVCDLNFLSACCWCSHPPLQPQMRSARSQLVAALQKLRTYLLHMCKRH